MIDPLNRRSHGTSPSRPSWLPPRADALTRPADSAFVFTLFATVDLVLCGIAAGFAMGLSNGLVPFLSALAILVAVQKPLVDRVAWHLLGPSGPFVAWSWFAGVSAIVGMGAAVALHDPIVCSHFRCGTGDIALILVSPIVVLVAGAFVTLALRHFVRPAYLTRRGVLALTAAAIFGLAAIVTVVQAARALYVADAQGYFDRMPAVATFAPVRLPTVLDVPAGAADPEHSHTFVDQQGGIEMTRVCGTRTRSCDVHVRFGSHISLPDEASDEFRWASVDDTISVYRDRDRPVFVFVREDHTPRRFDHGSVHPPRGYFAAAYDTSRRDWISISNASIARDVAAPHGWLFGALAGLFVAGFVALTMRRARRRVRAELAGFREAHLGTDTTLTFADGTAPMTLAGAGDFGPVVVLGGGDPDSSHYRDDGQRAPVFLAFGTLAQLRTVANQVLWGRAMYAVAVLLLASAPIFAFTYAQIP